MALRHVNAVIVGAGAGGGVVAKELAAAGLSVVLLERGKWHSARRWAPGSAPMTNATRASWWTSRAGSPWSPLPTAATATTRRALAAAPSAMAPWPGVLWRRISACAQPTARLRAARSRIGPSLTRTSNRTMKRPNGKWASRVTIPAIPSRGLGGNKEHQVLLPAAKRLGLHPFEIPMLRNTVPYNGRRACMRCRWCVGFACEVNARTGTHNTVIPTALATGSCELRTDCMTKEILLDSAGRANGVAYFDASDRLQRQTADLVIVAGGAVESARLLLNTRHRLFPDGLGNRHGWVGRNLQSHSYAGATGLFGFDTFDDLGPGASIAISDYNHGNPGLAGGAMLANEFIRLPYQFMGQVPPWVPRWGTEHKEFVRDAYRRTIVIMGPVQEMPLADARVQLDAKVKDHWGIPVARLSGGRHPHTIEIGRYIATKAEEWLKEAGAVHTWKRAPAKSLSGGQHQAGTCRMGTDPKTSVVDRDCRIHDMDNVYVIDASVHVTNGGFNPVLTILAKAYRASERLLQGWKGTKARS
ncbi:MAG: GMC family oxidoreductase [Candidatus Solibacter sp.]|nr:GMC family oxidoreductase [Candidatus Solibacter sp.]